MLIVNANILKTFLEQQSRNCHGYRHRKKAIYQEAIKTVRDYVDCIEEDNQPAQGHWLQENCEWGETIECSICHYEVPFYNNFCYCPRCGAKMKEEVKK